MKWKSTFFAVLALVMFWALSAQADIVQNFTNYKVQEYRGTLPSGGGWKDVIGDETDFATPSGSVTWGSSGDVTFQIYSNYPQSGIAPAGVGVLALDLDHNGTFEKGVVMAGTDAGKVYDVTSWLYSTGTAFNNGSWYYGGRFNEANPQPIPVAISAGTFTGQTGAVTWADISGTNPNYLVTLLLSGFNTGGAYNDFKWDWSAATCGNSNIGGHAQVPIPPSALLLGTGLLGLIGLRKWRCQTDA